MLQDGLVQHHAQAICMMQAVAGIIYVASCTAWRISVHGCITPLPEDASAALRSCVLPTQVFALHNPSGNTHRA